MAKKQVKAEKETGFKSPEPPKAEMNELANLMQYMTEQMQKRFNNQVFSKLNQETVEKFADAQIGNFANIFLKLAGAVKRKILKQFSDDRLEKQVRLITSKVNKRNKELFYKRVEDKIGINRKEMMNSEGLTFRINAFEMETLQWVKKLRDENLEAFTANTLRSMAQGESLAEVMENFTGLVEKRKNHAKFLARTQIANFNSLTTKLRAENIGITKAIWVTSRDERVRASHQARDGKEFELKKGLYSSIDGKWLLPGTDYQCFPGSAKINHTSLCQKFYRRWYTGELTELVRDDGVVIHTTPNHPIFTVDGFKAAGLIDNGDNILCTVEQGLDGIELDSNDMIPTFEQVFSSLEFLGVEHGIAPAVSGKFHGDVSDSDIDIIPLDSLLMSEIDASIRKKFAKFNFSDTDKMIVLEFFTCSGKSGFSFSTLGFTEARIMSVLNLVYSSFLTHLTPLELFRFALGSWDNSSLQKSFPDSSTGDSIMFRDSVFALSVLVHGLDVFDRKLDSFRFFGCSGNNNTSLFKLPREYSGANSSFSSSIFKQDTGFYKFCSIINNRTFDFSGHVYNLQTVSGDYITNTTAVSNCRCDYELIIPG